MELLLASLSPLHSVSLFPTTTSSMTLSKNTTESPENAPSSAPGQFSKFSINQDRPAKRRRNAKEPESGPSPPSSTPGSSAGSSQAEKDAGKNKDATVPVASRSCAECRRMKLKCDRIFPCKTCVRRGLEGICPDGSLVTGRGTRYVLASTQELHEKILRMSDRIKSLEEALEALHQEHSNCRPCTCQNNQKRDQPGEPHPLLHADLLLIKGQLELYGLNPSKEQCTSPREHSSQAESLLLQDAHNATRNSSTSEVGGFRVDRDKEPEEIPGTKRIFSVTEDGKGMISVTEDREGNERPALRTYKETRRSQTKESSTERGKRLREMLPPRDEAECLAREATWHAAWILNISSRPANRAKLLHDLYHGPVEEVRPQDVALVLTALALGERVDVGPTYPESMVPSSSGFSPCDIHRPSGNDRQSDTLAASRNDGNGAEEETHRNVAGAGKSTRRSAQESYCLAKVALNEVSLQGEPDQTVVHCLYLMGWYLAALADNKDAGREAMVVVDLAVKIAFKIGMHLEETYANLSAEAQQERRILFWALLHLESKLHLDSSSPGALGTANITVDRPFAAIPGAIRSFPSQTEAIYHDFKLDFLENCIVPTLTMVEKAPKLRLKDNDYYDVLALDGRIRDFNFPSVLAEPIAAPPPLDSFEFLPLSSHSNLNFILNPTTSTSSFNLSYSDGKTPRNVLRMIRVKARQEKLIALLYLHRTFFYAHIRDHRPLAQRLFLPSALAVFSVACELIQSAKEIYLAEPELSARVSMLWYNAFLAVINLFLLVVYKPFCPVAIIALQEIERARNLFLDASTNCHMAARSYPLLREFHSKASDVYNRWKEESEGDIGVFGPNGEVILCQTRIDVVIERLQCVSVPPSAEEAATSGLLSLKRCTNSPVGKQGTACNKSPRPPCSGRKVDDEPSYEMWQHVHKEITDLVRRVPEVLRDAAVDPCRATAARLIWGFIPLPEESKPEDMAITEEPEMDAGLPSDLDWNAFADALMFAPSAHPEILGGSPMQLDLVSPPMPTQSPESSQSNFSLFEFCSDYDFATAGPSGLTPEINMDGSWAMHGEDFVGLSRNYDSVLRNDAMLSPVDTLPSQKAEGNLQGPEKFSDGLGNNNILLSDTGDLDDGTLGFLWQHRMQSPFLS